MTRNIPTLALLPIALGLLSCGDDNTTTGEETSTGMQFVEVCGNGVDCGSSCVTDDSCPDGQYCSDEGSCYAECTPQMGCDGTCMADGRCSGTRQIVVKPTGGMDNGPLLVGDEQTSNGPGNGEGCAASQARGALTPVTMYVMLDNSLSMDQQQKWDNATRAVNAFFQDSATGGLKIALRFFDNPDSGGGCNEQACTNDTVASCGQPEVPLGELSDQAGDSQETALVDAVNRHNPDVAGTPLFAALTGATEWAVSQQAATPNEQVVVLFVTDGEPRQQDSCPRDATSIAQVAANAYTEGVLTYAIGLEGSNEQLMNSIASAGGTGRGIFVGSQNAESDLLAALNQIRGEAVSCDIQLPSSADSDPSEAMVKVTLSSGEMALSRVNGSSDCTNSGGWYFNDNQDPTRILLCDSTCDSVTNDSAPSIAIELGCLTTTVDVPGAR